MYYHCNHIEDKCGNQDETDSLSLSFLLLLLPIGLDKQNFKRKLINIFLPISFIICFVFSKEPSH